MKKWIALWLLSLSQFAAAGWQLDATTSRLNFITTKNNTVAEVHYFKNISGSVDQQGNILLKIALASVDTAIPIRDERMQLHLFETALFPKLTLSAKIAPNLLQQLTIGAPTQHSLSATINLHGASQTVTMHVLLTKLNGQHVLATSYQPVIINANDFKLSAGVDKLREIAKLPSISYAVPVTFSLLFKK